MTLDKTVPPFCLLTVPIRIHAGPNTLSLWGGALDGVSQRADYEVGIVLVAGVSGDQVGAARRECGQFVLHLQARPGASSPGRQARR